MRLPPIFLVLIIIFAAGRPTALAQGPEPLALPALKIGYLPEGTDLTPARPLLRDLRESLLKSRAVREALRRSGYSDRDIWLRPCDGPDDMIQRLQADEFELAFATPVVYARLFYRRGEGAISPDAGYAPILQFRMPQDVRSPRGVGVMRSAAIFVGPASPLWRREASEEEILLELQRSNFAVSDAFSASSYIFPQIKLRRTFPSLDPTQISFVFAGSSSEAVKHVVSGLAAFGACETRTLEAYGTVEGLDGPVRLYTKIMETEQIPTDPILLRRDLLPANAATNLGVELKLAVRNFFNPPPKPVETLWVEDSEPRAYDRMIGALVEFEAIHRSAAAGGEPPAVRQPPGRAVLPPLQP